MTIELTWRIKSLIFALVILVFAGAPGITSAAGIDSVIDSLGAGNVADNAAEQVQGAAQSAAASFESLFQKIEALVKNVYDTFKGACKKASEPNGFFGKIFEKLFNFLDIFDRRKSDPAETTLGQLSNGQQVKVLSESGGKYTVKKQDGSVATVGKKNIRVKSAPKPAAQKPAETAAKPSGDTPRGTGRVLSVKTTGYYPPPAGGYKSKKEAMMEGGAYDCRGNKLRTLQDYKPGSYVSCATDPRVIKTGTYFTIDEYPGVKFLACDVGGGIRGNHIDICCDNAKETYKVTGKATIRYL